MKLLNAGEQYNRHYMFDASGTIAAGGTAQLLLPQHQSRSYFFFSNQSNGDLVLEFGAARATCSVSGGAVSSSFSITNSGFGYTKPPVIIFFGGGYPDTSHGSTRHTGLNLLYVGAAGPGFPAPARTAKAYATLSGGSVNAIVLEDPGSNYAVAPQLFMMNSDLDPNGCATPSATVGRVVAAGGFIEWNGTCCTTDAVSIFGATNSQAFTCKFMT